MFALSLSACASETDYSWWPERVELVKELPDRKGVNYRMKLLESQETGFR